ncbi:MAG: restriction endonuclease [Methanothrix sp.]|nr:MAG: restriction endonuclease [Methanothrix sp.]
MHSLDPLIFSDAVREFWRIRERQANAQKERGQSDQGSRSAVTGGKQMDGFSKKIIELLMAAGIEVKCIFQRTSVELPGFFRPAKEWDIVAVVDGNLIAAIELKSQIGPSFGNNFNNRTEEALGTALDIWTAYREGAFRTSPAPWLGYLLVLEDCLASSRPVGVREPHFSVFPEFREASYAKRYELFCRKLIRERHYSSACFILADREIADSDKNYNEPAVDLSAVQFCTQLLGHANGAIKA